jgi:acetyltransferase-like isoleucine patch superfamily enzyme
MKSCGEGVKINSLTVMVNPEVIEIGEGTRLCDHTFLLGGKGLVIGKRVDVQPFVGIWGGGSCEIGDDVSLGMGTLIFTAQYDYEDEGKFLAMTDFATPHSATYAHTRIDRHAYIGGGAKILGGVHIGEGAVIGLGTVVIRDVPAWDIVVGNPARKIGERPSISMTNGDRMDVKDHPQFYICQQAPECRQLGVSCRMPVHMKPHTHRADCNCHCRNSAHCIPWSDGKCE